MVTQEEIDNSLILEKQAEMQERSVRSANLINDQKYAIEEKERSIAESQLEVNETLDKIYNELKQNRYKKIDGDKMDWVEMKDQSKRTLTDWGVEKLMQTMRMYINKENLLSNFSEEQINDIMLTYRLALNANFYMKYEVMFRQPTFEECKKILDEKIKEKIKVKAYCLEILGKTHDEEKIKKDLLKEIESRIEYEIKKIRVERIKECLRDWELMFESLSQMVFATLNRAWKGEERGSLRRHTNISEILGRNQTSPQPENIRGVRSFFR